MSWRKTVILLAMIPYMAYAQDNAACHVIYLRGSHFPDLDHCPKDVEKFAGREHSCLYLIDGNAGNFSPDTVKNRCAELDCDRLGLLKKYAHIRQVHDALLKDSIELHENYEKSLNLNPECD